MNRHDGEYANDPDDATPKPQDSTPNDPPAAQSITKPGEVAHPIEGHLAEDIPHEIWWCNTCRAPVVNWGSPTIPPPRFLACH